MASPESLQQRDPTEVMEPNYFSNWGDLWYPRWANRLLVPASRLRFLTPNQVTLASFFLYLASACLIVWGGSWAWLAAVLLPLSYVLDCLDGQLARYTGKTSTVGDYLDKTLDVLKIGIINAAFAAAAWQMTGEVGYVFLGLLSCFGFLFRYFIKLETIFSSINQDPAYLDKSRARRHALYAALEAERCAPKNGVKQIRWLWSRHRTMFALDEAEHVTFGAIAVGMQRPDCWLWLFGIGQIIIALVRLIQRGRQVATQSETLTDPMRK